MVHRGITFLTGLAALTVLAVDAHAIVNGSLVSDQAFEAEYPWAVVIVGKVSGGICGGVLIAPRWVLTAAHCTGTRKYVLAGHAKRAAARRIEVERAIRHPGFSGDSLQNDVGLLYLAEPVDAPVAALPTKREAVVLLLPGMSAGVAGWGKTEISPQPSERLVEGRIELDKLELRGSQINYSYKGGGPCGRDSGSPMLMRTLDGRRLVVGVASGTDGNLCSLGGGGATYTNLAAVRGFIQQHVEGI
ncbi:MAG: serine protease [Gammaproteobacteria bacterium]|jgi:secreted trypsin-like serine protease|nr:serine protease [Gammaproteobacteria bacterium]MDP6615911.1 serine protease [Gammaproteobacteria bacterium]MDP6695050.1 serine protease [Gammaproteobacteria bacterium]MDP7041744.1 serine protease [Gammaproteobacteria bacterium]